MQILEAIRANGPLSASDLSELFRLESTGLYYHIRLLQKAGLIHESGTRQIESYAATHQNVRVKCNLKNAKESKRLRKLVDAYIVTSQESFGRDPSAAGSAGLLSGLRWENLSAAEVAQIRGLASKIHAVLDQAKRRRSRAKSPQQSRANWHIGAFMQPACADHYPVTPIACV